MQFVGYLDLAFSILEPGLVVSGVDAILSEKLDARRLREQDVVLLTKRDRASCPVIGFIVQTIVLITTAV